MLARNPIVSILKTKYILTTKVNKSPGNVENINFSQALYPAKKVKTIDTALRYVSDYEFFDIKQISKALSDASFGTLYDIKKSPGGGHCLLHSVIYGVNNQLFLQNTCDLNDIIELIRIETTSNIDLYVSFLVRGTRARLLAQMYMYIYEKKYDTPYEDMLPLVLSNALCLNLIILSQSASDYEIHKVIAGLSGNSDKYILVHKYKDHNDGITIKAEINHVNINDQTFAFCTPSISDSNSPLVACQPTHVPGSLNNISGGDFLSCNALDTTSTTSSDEHKCHDASRSRMNESVSDASNINVNDGPVTYYIYIT